MPVSVLRQTWPHGKQCIGFAKFWQECVADAVLRGVDTQGGRCWVGRRGGADFSLPAWAWSGRRRICQRPGGWGRGGVVGSGVGRWACCGEGADPVIKNRQPGWLPVVRMEIGGGNYLAWRTVMLPFMVESWMSTPPPLRVPVMFLPASPLLERPARPADLSAADAWASASL